MTKKIAIITSEYPPEPGGIGNHAYNLAQSLSNQDVEVSVLTNSRNNQVNEEYNFDQNHSMTVIRIKRFRYSLLTYTYRIIKGFKLAASLEKESIVIASGKFSLWLAAILAIFFRRIRYISIIHGSEINPPSYLSLQLTNWSLKCFEKNIAVSSFTESLLRDKAIDLKISVINNGYDAEKFSLSKRKTVKIKGKPALITVGAVSRRKGQQNVIKALPSLINIYPDLHYHIVGLPKETLSFKDLAKTLNVLSHITFHGAVSDQRLIELLAGSDIFMMLSESLPNGDVEGFGIAILEANSLGIPAIGSLNSGIKDAIQNGNSGMIVEPHSTIQIVEALVQILSDYQTFSSKAEDWAKGFDWQVVINHYLKEISF